jgi:hypothetical protein
MFRSGATFLISDWAEGGPYTSGATSLSTEDILVVVLKIVIRRVLKSIPEYGDRGIGHRLNSYSLTERSPFCCLITCRLFHDR